MVKFLWGLSKVHWNLAGKHMIIGLRKLEHILYKLKEKEQKKCTGRHMDIWAVPQTLIHWNFSQSRRNDEARKQKIYPGLKSRVDVGRSPETGVSLAQNLMSLTSVKCCHQKHCDYGDVGKTALIRLDTIFMSEKYLTQTQCKWSIRLHTHFISSLHRSMNWGRGLKWKFEQVKRQGPVAQWKITRCQL